MNHYKNKIEGIDGYDDGRNNPFDQDRNIACDEFGYRTYYNGFIEGCESAEIQKKHVRR
jgi:hypothetical protein